SLANPLPQFTTSNLITNFAGSFSSDSTLLTLSFTPYPSASTYTIGCSRPSHTGYSFLSNTAIPARTATSTYTVAMNLATYPYSNGEEVRCYMKAFSSSSVLLATTPNTYSSFY